MTRTPEKDRPVSLNVLQNVIETEEGENIRAANKKTTKNNLEI